MVIRGLIGIVLCAVGGIWIAQGEGAMKGSMMSGHSQYAVLGVVVALIGLAFLVWAWRVHGRRRSS
jgi:protein-S-isoprenylcysteine O-methyltransferase Ste14